MLLAQQLKLLHGGCSECDLQDSKVCNWLIWRILCGSHEGDKWGAVFALAKEFIPGSAKDGLQLIIQLTPEPGPVCDIPHAIPNDAEGLVAPQLQHGILQAAASSHHDIQVLCTACDPGSQS